MSNRVTHRQHPQRDTILGDGTTRVRMGPVADFTKNADATLNLVQLLIAGTTCLPKLLASDAFTTTTPSARQAASVAISALSRLPGQHLL